MAEGLIFAEEGLFADISIIFKRYIRKTGDILKIIGDISGLTLIKFFFGSFQESNSNPKFHIRT